LLCSPHSYTIAHSASCRWVMIGVQPKLLQTWDFSHTSKG
jgi:hypothetical protein